VGSRGEEFFSVNLRSLKGQVRSPVFLRAAKNSLSPGLAAYVQSVTLLTFRIGVRDD